MWFVCIWLGICFCDLLVLYSVYCFGLLAWFIVSWLRCWFHGLILWFAAMQDSFWLLVCDCWCCFDLRFGLVSLLVLVVGLGLLFCGFGGLCLRLVSLVLAVWWLCFRCFCVLAWLLGLCS